MEKLKKLVNKIILKNDLSKSEWDYVKKNILNEPSLECFNLIKINFENINIQYSWRIIPTYFNNEESIKNFKKYIDEYQLGLETNRLNRDLTLFNSFSNRMLKNKLIPSIYKIPFLYYLSNNEYTLRKISNEDIEQVFKYWINKDINTDISLNYNMMYILLEALGRSDISNVLDVIDNNFKYNTLDYNDNIILIKFLYKSNYFKKMNIEQYSNLLKIINLEIDAAMVKYSNSKHWKTHEKINNLTTLKNNMRTTIAENLGNRNTSLDKLGGLLL